ncbi:MAG: hypothetical protein AB7V06_26915 [Candidatus Obscuribacterales bacterium]
MYESEPYSATIAEYNLAHAENRHLGIEVAGLTSADRNVEGVVGMMLDATQHYDSRLTKKRLCDWQASLFPTGRSGLFKIKTGSFRDDSSGPMQVVSGQMGSEKVHFEAPAAYRLTDEVRSFLDWFNEAQNDLDPVLIPLPSAGAHKSRSVPPLHDTACDTRQEISQVKSFRSLLSR